jgi:predicted TPR repeat methyltransferase
VKENIAERVGNFFDQRAEKFHRIYASTALVERTVNRVLRRAIYARTEVLLDEVRRLQAPTLLDVGSGTGVNTFDALRAGASRALGLDLASTMVSMARKGAEDAGFADRCRFEEGDFMTWQESERFDVVAALGVFDYVKEAESFLRKMCRSAERTVVASFPGRGVRGRIRKVRYEAQGCPLFLYDEDEVRGWASSEGFSQVLFPFRDSSGFVLAARR